MAEQHDHQLSSEEWSSKDSQPDKEHHMRSANSIDHNETIAPLPTAETQQTGKSLEPQKTSSHLQTARGRLGLNPAAPVIEEHDVAEHSDLWWPKVRLALKEPFAEVRVFLNRASN